jgi:hypothetical protein
VHIIGTKYTDYFTDGTTVIAYPGDPKIDGNLDKPDAPIPSQPGMTWVHTTGGYLYDTPSGDLELNDYAQQADGSYIGRLPASTYTDATSSVALPDRFATAGSETEIKADISQAIATATPGAPASDASASAVAPATSNTAATTTSSSSPTPTVLGTSTAPATTASSSPSAQSPAITTPSTTPAASSTSVGQDASASTATPTTPPIVAATSTGA